MPLQPDQILLHYRLLEQIGEGGMGVVWKAEDTSLHREVAIKVLPTMVSRDPERLVRFDREAKLLASLNQQGKTIVMVTHEQEIAQFATHRLHMIDGLIDRIEGGD